MNHFFITSYLASITVFFFCMSCIMVYTIIRDIQDTSTIYI